ncbi:MAG: beta family protein [Thermodesulfovibrionales bacterium]|nr:beta family protein [Thermodesulfovibrionales bacterium]
MFNSKHYIPILKWKSAERQALEKLSAEEKEYISPLIQIIMPLKGQKKGEEKKVLGDLLAESIISLKTKIPGLPEEILKFWGKAPAFIDFSLIDESLREQGFAQTLKKGNRLGMALIPVISLNADIKLKTEVTKLAKVNNHGLCLRLARTNFLDQTKLMTKINDFLTSFSLSEKDIDLLIDFQDEQCLKFSDLCQQIPNISKWRTFTFGCGSFPVDLTECSLGKNLLVRSDWNNWKSQLNSKTIQRIPSFGDYTILHPIYKEQYQFFPPSASIRYTLKDKWLVMRGQKLKSVQYLANARLLSRESEFFGDQFSYGDHYIAEKGKDLKGKPGNATTWLVAGINHHLACTVSQIANLP